METLGMIPSKIGSNFTVHSGISDALLHQLVAFSTCDDPNLRAFTHDATRFGTLHDTQEWVRDTARQIYTLTPENNENTLAGFAWLRQENQACIPDAVEDETLFQLYQQTSGDMRHTVAGRIYGRYRGLKLANPFMVVAQKDYMAQTKKDVAMILADIHSENIPSQTLFQRLGYKFLGPKGEERTLWVLDAKG